MPVRRVLAQRWTWLAAVFAILLIADYGSTGFTSLIDQKLGDVMLAANASRRPVSDRVVIVDIDQRSLELMNAMAGSWPWPRSVHGELIDHVEWVVGRHNPAMKQYTIAVDESPAAALM